MEFLNSFFHFFTDKTRRLSSKAVTSLIVVALIIFIDNTLSFSYYYNTENKIRQISNISEILADTTLSKKEKSQILKLRENIVNRKTWKDKAWDLVSNMNFKSDDSLSEEQAEELSNVKVSERSYLWHFISSSWLFLILLIAFPFVGIFDKNTPLGQAIGILLLIEPTLYGAAWILAKLFSFIPIILDNPTYNYILNAILCVGVFVVFGVVFGKKKS